jgi:RHS repeat-associated protein
MLAGLSATTQNPQAKPHLLVQMTQAGTPADKRDSSGNLRSLEMMQSMISAFPEHMQKEMEKGMKHMLEKGPTPLGRTIMSNMGIDPDKMWGGIREGLQEIKQQEQTPVEIHFYHCDHLGTPIALTDRNGKIVWAAKYDPWGNIEEEFNPHNIEQNIRLPGQHHDRETGLYYNRHRYYDPKIGAYINQDPIGLLGGANFYYYPMNPLRGIDPLGLYQMCHRKFDPVPVPVARHCFIKFEDGSTSSFDNKGVHADPAPNKPGTVCTPAKESWKDSCIKKTMKKCESEGENKGEKFDLTKFNCCHCAEQAMKDCGTSIPASSWPNWPVNPGPQRGEPGYTPNAVFGPDLGK